MFSLLLFLLSVRAEAEPSAWSLLAAGDFEAAATALAEAAPAERGPEARRARKLGLALVALNAQPRTQSGLEKAGEELRALQAERADDEAGIAARYLEARLHQVHLESGDTARAERLFEALWIERPEHALAQQARVKLALLRIYAPAATAEQRRAAHESAARDATRLADPAARAPMHLLLAEAARRLGYGTRAELEQLLAAEASGIVKTRLRGETLLRAGELARGAGETETARACYSRFLEIQPRNERRAAVAARLARLREAHP